jgi:hypothetical protein
MSIQELSAAKHDIVFSILLPRFDRDAVGSTLDEVSSHPPTSAKQRQLTNELELIPPSLYTLGE